MSADMSVNSTSSFNQHLGFFCATSIKSSLISIALIATKTVLTLPPCIFVLYVGYQRWRQQRSFKALSHSDVFTYHLSLIELFWAPGLVCYIHGQYSSNKISGLFGRTFCAFTFFAEIMFNLLTCVEWYLAVVHPVSYLMFRNHRGVRIRNISIGCVWLLCLVLIGLQRDLQTYYDTFYDYSLILKFFFMVVSVVTVTFCSFSALWVLIRPGPGEGRTEKVDQSKLRFFLTITAISSVLWVWFVVYFLFYALYKSPLLNDNVGCELLASGHWLNLPTSLVAPVLYLHRAGKLACCFNRE